MVRLVMLEMIPGILLLKLMIEILPGLPGSAYSTDYSNDPGIYAIETSVDGNAGRNALSTTYGTAPGIEAVNPGSTTTTGATLAGALGTDTGTDDANAAGYNDRE